MPLLTLVRVSTRDKRDAREVPCVQKPVRAIRDETTGAVDDRSEWIWVLGRHRFNCVVRLQEGACVRCTKTLERCVRLGIDALGCRTDQVLPLELAQSRISQRERSRRA